MRLVKRWFAFASGVLLFGCSSDGPKPATQPAKLDTSSNHLVFEVDVEGRPIRVDVANHDHVAPQLRTFEEVGGKIVERPTNASLNRCQYQGTVTRLDVPNAKPSWAAVSTCNGVAGSFSLDHVLFEMSPGDKAGEARVFRASQAPAVIERTTLRPVAATTLGTAAEALTVPTRFLEVVVVADPTYNALYGAGAQSRAVQVANYADALFRDPSLSHSIGVVLVGYVSLSSSPFTWSTVASGEASSNSLLTNFKAWYHGTAGLPATDDPVLLSGLDFDGSTIGLAGVGSAGDPAGSGAIVQSTFPSAAYNALTTAHELGHTVGMQHDNGATGTPCDSSAYIMTPVSCSSCTTNPTTWSTCSDQYLTAWLATSQFGAALSNLPTANAVRCGDGLVQGNEQCDCGDSDCSVNDPCCDGTTCQLKSGAACSRLNGCCDASCQIVRDARVCRAAANSCQTDAVCDTISPVCPANTPAPNGNTCDDGSGTANAGRCLQGNCASGDLAQCQNLVAQGYPVTGITTCSFQATFNSGNPCNVLYCGTNNDPTSCTSFTQSGGGSVTVTDGTDCGTGLQCHAGTCQPSGSIPTCPSGQLQNACGGCGALTANVGIACGSGTAGGTTKCGPTGQITCDPSVGYPWVVGDFGPCSVTCGTGTQTQTVTCRDASGAVVSDSLCLTPKPTPATQTCTAPPCATYSWQIGTFGTCSATCGGGTQTRAVSCVQDGTTTIVDASLCAGPPPATTQTCNTQACPTYAWQTGAFGTCSATCGGGTQTRSVTCVQSGTTTVVADSFCPATKPATQQTCNTQPCTSNRYVWVQGGFGECSEDCGGGIQKQSVTCRDTVTGKTVSASLCPTPAPPTKRACNTDLCDGSPCTTALSCMSDVCAPAKPGKPKTCRPPTCTDGVRNGRETGVDCGGDCRRCK